MLTGTGSRAPEDLAAAAYSFFPSPSWPSAAPIRCHQIGTVRRGCWSQEQRRGHKQKGGNA